MSMTLFLLVMSVSGASAGTSCALPEAYPIALEARGALLGVGRGVVAVEQPRAGSPLAPGDAIRQANGDAVETCDDVERAAAEAFAKGLPLLLAVERPTGLVPVLVPARAPGADAPEYEPEVLAAEPQQTGVVEAVSVGATRDAAVAPAVAVADHEVPASARALAVVSPSAPVPNGATTGSSPERGGAERAVAAANGGGRGAERERAGDAPVVARAAVAEARRDPPPLPPVATVSVELRSHVERSVEMLREVEAHATVAVPVAIYERDRVRADAAIREIDFGSGDDAHALRSVVFDVLAAHHAASEILAAKAQYQDEMNQKMRTRAPREMPYFSDGDVPRWVAAFPFLQEAVLAPPKDRRFLQSSGRWSPDRAVALLWAHARDETTRLVSWTAGD